MNRTSTQTGKLLTSMLINSKKDNFLSHCHKLLGLFFTNLEIDYDLDLVIEGGKDYSNLFYCVSTNNKALIPKDIQNLHIEKICKKYSNIQSITLLYNKNLIDEKVREANKNLLISLNKQYNINLIKTFGPNEFIKYIFDMAQEYLIEKIHNANKKFKSEYQNRLSKQDFYIEDVPFIIEKNKKYNPKQFIYSNFIIEKKSTAKSWSFIISEFGFGKTSLLLNLPDYTKSYKYIYIPIAQIGADAFSNEALLAKAILENILDKDLNTKDSIFDKILVTEFTQLLHTEKKFVLLYDGLDEHHHAYTEKGLRHIFNCATSFNCNSIFTVRKEFIDERRGNFENALELRVRPKYNYINLVEWTNKEILFFIRELNITKLYDFEKLVKNNKYNEVYGDIPKRPLFLKMLTDDILSGKTKTKNIAQLYESYLMKKFLRDREGSILSSKSTRPLSKDGDILFVTDFIFYILAKIAWNMVDIQNLNIIYIENIEERDILDLIKSGYEEIKIIELLLNSVLIPFNKRERRTFKAKFAHKSFQEYFLAYYLIFILLAEKTINTSALILKYSKGTMDFCKFMVRDVDGLQEKIDNLFANLNFEIDESSLIYRLATIESHQKRKVFLDRKIVDSKDEEFDFFVSHSSRDKIPFVEELVGELTSLGLNIFYDSESIQSADNVVWRINHGFTRLKYGIITVISQNFIDSNWCNEELSISFSLKVEKEKVLIPILLNISFDEVKEKYTILRGIKPIDMVNQNVKSIALEIYNNKQVVIK